MKKLIAALVIALLVGGVAIAVTVGVLNSPKQVASRTLNNVMEELAEREEFASLQKILTGGSIEFSAGSESLNDLLETEKNCAVAGKIYFSENAVMLNDLTVNYGAVLLQGDVYCSEELIYVDNREILNGVWGLEKGDLYDDWTDSIFAPDSQSEFALDQETFAMVGELLNALDEDMDRELMADLKDLSDRYAKKTWKIVRKYAEFESEKDEIRINKERENARIITITLDSDAVASILEDLYDYIEKDDELANLVAKYGDKLATVLKETYKIEDAAEAYDQFIADLADEVEMTVDSIEKYMKDDLIVTMVTPPSSAELLMLTIEDEETEYLTVEIGHEGIRKTNCISVKLWDRMEVAYRINEDSKDAFSAEIEMNGDVAVSLEIDRKDENYQLDVKNVCRVEGDLIAKRGKYTITVDRVQSLAIGVIYDYKNLGITLKLQEKDKMPEPAEEIKSVLSVDKETFKKWEDRLEDCDFPIFDMPMFIKMSE